MPTDKTNKPPFVGLTEVTDNHSILETYTTRRKIFYTDYLVVTQL